MMHLRNIFVATPRRTKKYAIITCYMVCNALLINESKIESSFKLFNGPSTETQSRSSCKIISIRSFFCGARVSSHCNEFYRILLDQNEFWNPTQIATKLKKDVGLDFADRASFVFLLDGALTMLSRDLEKTNAFGIQLHKFIPLEIAMYSDALGMK